MSNELLAIKDLRVYTATPQAGSIGIPAPVEGFQIVETPCARLKCSDKNALCGTVNFVPIGCTAGGGYTLTSGVGSITASATKVKSDNFAVLREGDEGNCSGVQANQTGSITCFCTMKVQTAGQLKARGK